MQRRYHACRPRRQCAGGGQVLPAQDAEDRYPDVVERLAQQLLVPAGRDAVEHHATEPQQLVVRPEAVHQRGHRLAHRAGVDDQHDRGPQQARELRGGLAVGAPGQSVVQAHGAFHHGQVGAPRPVPEKRPDPGGAHQPRVEVARPPAGGEPEVRGVDVVGAGLEPGHRQPARGVRGQQSDGDSRLAVAGGGRTDHHPWCGAHSVSGSLARGRRRRRPRRFRLAGFAWRPGTFAESPRNGCAGASPRPSACDHSGPRAAPGGPKQSAPARSLTASPPPRGCLRTRDDTGCTPPGRAERAGSHPGTVCVCTASSPPPAGWDSPP